MVLAKRLLLGAISGLLIAFALPPWGWWPLGIIGFALFAHGTNSASRLDRFAAGWAAGFVWLAIGELWMFDLTPPGYVFVFVVFGAGYGLVAVAAGSNDHRLILLPAGFVLYEWIRWSFPFGGVPLATVPMTQVASPLAKVLPLGGALLLTAVTVATGLTVLVVVQQRWKIAGTMFGAVIVLLAIGAIAPNGTTIGTIDVAVVQGGGPQRTRADTCKNQEVFDRHRDATASMNRQVDLVVWPENVVNPIADGRPLGRCDDLFYMSEAIAATADIARSQDAVLIPGWFHSGAPTTPDNNVNYSTAITAEGETVSRYDKVRTVPFGEFVPLRGLIEQFSSDVPGRDVLQGQGPAVLESPVATLGVSISWEIFFDSRARAAIRDGGEILVNPTNGSSYWLTILQTQQVASSRLRAMETGRWVLQAAPTGFSAIIDQNGTIIDRTAISEQRVLYATVQRRGGLTLATQFGPTPMLVIAASAFAWVLGRRRLRARSSTSLDHR